MNYEVIKRKKNLTLHRLYKLFGKTKYFENSFGVKAYNKPLFKLNGGMDFYFKEFVPSELRLGFDALVDEYTLVNVSIKESPHFDLVSRINDNYNIENCDYFERVKNGCLDGRLPENPKSEDYIHAFNKSKNKDDKLSFPIVYNVEGEYYILDGKHRISMAALFDQTIKCLVIDKEWLRQDPYCIAIYMKMKCSKINAYSKNLQFMHKIMDVSIENKKVLIINRNRTDNFGDQAIGYSMYNLYKDLQCDVYLSEFSNEKGRLFPQLSNSNSSIGGIKKVLLKFLCLRKLAWKISNQNLFLILNEVKFDTIIIGGGELIQSNFTFPVALENWIRNINRYQSQANVYFFGVGVTDSFSKFDYRCIKRSLPYITDIYVRDVKSQENLLKLFNRNSKVVADVVFYNKYDTKDINRDSILYGLTEFSRIKKYGIFADSKEDYYIKCKNNINELSRKNNNEVKLFYTTGSDYKTCIDFINWWGNGAPKMDHNVISLKQLIEEVSRAYLVVSPRMHGCILSQIAHTTVVPLCISPKMLTYNTTYSNIENIDSLREKIIVAARKIIS